MHALVTRVTIHDADATREVLNTEVVPQLSVAPGFKSGYWTWSTGDGQLNGLAMMIFDSEDNARSAGDLLRKIGANAPAGSVTVEGAEVRDVVASA